MVVLNSTEKIYDALQNSDIEMRNICDREKIELEADDLRIIVRPQFGGNVVVEVKRKCTFSGFFTTENSFIWHIQSEENITTLVERIKKVQTTLENGPYGFSKRSTYIKRKNKIASAKSGNFVRGARVNRIVSIGEKGIVCDELSIPNSEPWFLIELDNGMMPDMEIVYNMENWWLVDDDPHEQIFGGSSRSQNPTVTSVLERTKGKLLTVHDKFVIDLAVRLFTENRSQ